MSGLNRHISATQLARLVRIDPGTRPYYQALASSVRSLILDGGLAVRVRLPAERHLAAELGVSRTTVTSAYDRLREEGYLASRQGAGSWTELPDSGALGVDNPWVAAESGGLLPMHCAAPAAGAALAAAVEAAAAELPRYALGIGYEPTGLPALRELVAARYTERGAATRPEQILITPGAQQAMNLITLQLMAPGDALVVESPTYPHILDLARLRAARIVPVGIPPDGWHLDLLTSAMRQSAARLAYLMPDFQNPTGRLMGDEKRAELVAAARACGTTLVIDESWAETAVDDVPATRATAAFDTDGRVISIGSASKLWWGGLRIGWIRTTAAMVRRLAVLRAGVDIASPVLEQLVVARLFQDIDAGRAERRRALAASRAALTAALAAELPSWTYTMPHGGGVVWARLPGPTATPLAEAAASRGVRLAPGPWFGVDGTLEAYVRMPYTQSPQVVTEAVRRVAAAFHGGPGPVRRSFEAVTPAL
ncbi:DNA-binding transcriptional regulator, MocR family, contains an aminotransferase domain [Sinosporangium album]|uniref:DNA-binding transcriptional regulator, MocR family, contains an aminotransferase domain n=1 Tax=Sinosporangium album TaxID=504805 RepID=A0A1G8G0S2_9ACTN|nr:PLP-dependent aminotransferase family protein [Sinosporangium album]SDH87999.1 DNA-binding transcriptional regulator, MocR family, contains an aminotransferase domain [Sinosporangium album]